MSADRYGDRTSLKQINLIGIPHFPDERRVVQLGVLHGSEVVTETISDRREIPESVVETLYVGVIEIHAQSLLNSGQLVDNPGGFS